jgi:hypothetical protein
VDQAAKGVLLLQYGKSHRNHAEFGEALLEPNGFLHFGHCIELMLNWRSDTKGMILESFL